MMNHQLLLLLDQVIGAGMKGGMIESGRRGGHLMSGDRCLCCGCSGCMMHPMIGGGRGGMRAGWVRRMATTTTRQVMMSREGGKSGRQSASVRKLEAGVEGAGTVTVQGTKR